MDRFNYQAGEKDQGAAVLVLNLGKSLRAGQSSSGVGVGLRIPIFPGKYCGCHAGTWSTSAEYSLKDVWRSRSIPSRLFSLDKSGVACFCAFSRRTR